MQIYIKSCFLKVYINNNKNILEVVINLNYFLIEINVKYIYLEKVLQQLKSLLFGLESGEMNAANLSHLNNPSRLLMSFLLDFNPPYKLPLGMTTKREGEGEFNPTAKKLN